MISRFMQALIRSRLTNPEAEAQRLADRFGDNSGLPTPYRSLQVVYSGCLDRVMRLVRLENIKTRSNCGGQYQGNGRGHNVCVKIITSPSVEFVTGDVVPRKVVRNDFVPC